MNLEEIKEFVKTKHGKQKRKHGTPYYLHPFNVAKVLADKGYDLDYQVAGLFHDLLEDTDTTYEDLLNLSNIRVADSVKLLTKENGYQMSDYISRIEKNEIAKMVKLADRIHNLSEAHLASLEFVQKYIIESKLWYLEMAKNTPFEKDLIQVLKSLERNYNL